MSQKTPPKPLNVVQGVEVARILFTRNTEPEQVHAFMKEAGLQEPEFDAYSLRMEWCAFVHAVVAAGLMAYAPNVVFVEYLRQTWTLLGERGLAKEQCEAFVDGWFAPYMALLAAENQRECPSLFFKRVLGADRLEDVPRHSLARVSVAMALTIGAVFDALERYDILPETGEAPAMFSEREGRA